MSSRWASILSIWSGTTPTDACLAWSSAPRHLGSRDRYIGWSATARRRNIRLVAYNTRFLIRLDSGPASGLDILGQVTNSLSHDWEQRYGHPIYFAETFISATDSGR